VNHGRVVERGTHSQLLARDGLYRELHEAQHGTRRRRAAAAVSPEGLAEMTTAIVGGHEGGEGLSGPALAELARAMAGREPLEAAVDDSSTPAWLLLGAAWPVLSEGSAQPLRELAARRYEPGDPLEAAPRMARQLLLDLGLEDEQDGRWPLPNGHPARQAS
jgi:hypothetical protein